MAVPSQSQPRDLQGSSQTQSQQRTLPLPSTLLSDFSQPTEDVSKSEIVSASVSTQLPNVHSLPPDEPKSAPCTDCTPNQNGFARNKLDLLPSAVSFITEEVIDNETPTSFNLKREMFSQMQIIGQFNCGFILTRLSLPDCEKELILIIDQHAADERYRLEMLMAQIETSQSESQLASHSQRLIIPLTIALSIQDWLFFQEHQADFNQLGFLAQPSSHQENSVSISAVPMVAGITLNGEEFLDVLALMRESKFNGLHQLDRVITVLASKACRGAVMIGEPLDLPKMKTIVSNLANLDKPWVTKWILHYILTKF